MSVSEALLTLQKRYTDYFSLWRSGDPISYDYNAHDRETVLRYMRFPRQGQWNGLRRKKHWMGVKKPPSRMRCRTHHQHDQSPLGPRVYKRQAMAATAVVGARLEVADFRVVKTLGWGGLGLACLVEGTEKDGERFRVVCKVDLHHGHADALRKEKMNHVSMAGARHIAQRVVLQGPKQAQKDQGQLRRNRLPGRTTSRIWKPALTSVTEDDDDMEVLDKDEVLQDIKKMSREELDASNDLLFIEFMRRGDLGVYMKKAARQGVRFPDRVLWHVFECLFKAVIAMAYPNHFRPRGADAESNNMPLVTEDYRGQGPLNAELPTLVHFDLDPLNILVGDYDGEEHNLVPLLKVADLGIAEIVDTNFRNDPWDIWSVRRNGKLDILTPEQFTEEWDFIKRTPISMLGAERGTAGNYHWWTNMYQVGQVMWTLITLCHLQCPPEPEPYSETAEDGTTKAAWSYGTYLLEDTFGHVDHELRALVVGCMKHNPTERPTMAEIDAMMELKVRGQLAAEEESAVRRFCLAMFGDPPPPVRGADNPVSEPITTCTVGSPKMATPPPHLQLGPLPPAHRTQSRGIRTAGSRSSASRDGASRLNLQPIRVTMDTRRRPDANAGAEPGPSAGRGRPAAPAMLPVAMDDARREEMNRVARDPLARSRRMFYSRARDWLGL